MGVLVCGLEQVFPYIAHIQLLFTCFAGTQSSNVCGFAFETSGSEEEEDDNIDDDDDHACNCSSCFATRYLDRVANDHGGCVCELNSGLEGMERQIIRYSPPRSYFIIFKTN
jgi:hypothetical protein